MRKLATTILVASLIFIHIGSADAKSHKHHSKSKHQITLKHKTKHTSRKVSAKVRSLRSELSTASRGESPVDIIMRKAASAIGTPYSFGSTGNGSFDCSGFTAYAFKAAGIELPHSSSDQATLGTHVEQADLQKGDLVFFTNRGETRIGHVGIYIGNNKFIHASTNLGVTITDLGETYYAERYSGARRILKETKETADNTNN